ncbi:MAG: CRISPR-associated endonuclease Cas6, partial [Bacteroides sp.]
AQREIPLFRGAIIQTMDNAPLLFHNHEKDKLRYSYPLIQYKCINQCAAIVCVSEGAETIGDFFSNGHLDIRLGQKTMTLDIDSIKATQCLVQTWDDYFIYHTYKWMPLNQVNYQRYIQLESIVDKYAMLEKLLVANILSFAKGLGVYFDKQVICRLIQVNEPTSMTYKGVKMLSFDIEFKSNISIPDYIGLGKGVSQGHGIVVKK